MGLANFQNGIMSFGIPVMGGGGIPATFGDVIFVDGTYGSDDNPGGKDKDLAFATYGASVTEVTTNNNDVIVIDGYSEISETAMVTLSKNRVHTIGLNGPPPVLGYGAGARMTMGVVAGATNTATFRNTGVRNTFTGIKFSNANTTSTCLHSVEEGGEYARYNFCEFYKSTLLTTDQTAEVLMNGDSSQFYGCTFGDLVNERGASGVERPNVKLDRETITGKVCRDAAFVDCLFQHKAAHADACFFYGHNATDVERRLLIVRPIFWNCTLATAAIGDAVDFGAAQTTGDVLIVDPAAIKTTALGGASLNVFVQGAVPTAATTGIAVEVAA